MKTVVTSKGQVTIPVIIRTKAKIFPGTKLDFEIERDGSLKVTLVNQEISKLKGMVKPKKQKPVSLREMKKAIHDAAKENMQ